MARVGVPSMGSILWRLWEGGPGVKYVHLFIDGAPGEVATVEIYDDGYVAFNRDVEYSIQDLKDVIAEAEFELDNAWDNGVDCDTDAFDAWVDSLNGW